MKVNGPAGHLPGLDAQLLKAAVSPRLPDLDSLRGGGHSIQDKIAHSLAGLADSSIQDLLKIAEQRISPEALHHITAADAKNAAEKAVSNATQLIESVGLHSLRISGHADPHVVLALANQLIETGQVPNYLRATELATIIAAWYEKPVSTATPSQDSQPVAKRAGGGTAALRALWKRVPLLVLLGAWLLFGVILGLAFRVFSVDSSGMSLELWGLGFLVMVVAQFLITIRGAFRRK
jgi:hypothetical protein